MLELIINNVDNKEFIITSSNEECINALPIFKFNSPEEALLAASLWVCYFKENKSMQKYFRLGEEGYEVNRAFFHEFSWIYEATRRILFNEQDFDWSTWVKKYEGKERIEIGIKTEIKVLSGKIYSCSREKGLSNCVFGSPSEVFIFESIYAILGIMTKDFGKAFSCSSKYIGCIFRLLQIEESDWSNC